VRTASKLVVFFLVLAVALAAPALLAQTGTASLRGEVTDPNAAVIVNTKVTLTNKETKLTRTTSTDDSGGFQFLALPPGVYELKVETTGFRAASFPNIELLVNTVRTLDVKLEIGQVTETVVVSEDAAAINTVDATLGNVITPQQVMSLPLEGRSPAALITLQAGVTYSGDPADSRSASVSGARSDQSNITLDGVDVNAQQTGDIFVPAVRIPLGAIQEFRFTTSNPNTDQGRSSGGQIALVTRSGSNDFHGLAYWGHRNTATTSNDFFNNKATPRVPVPKLLRNQYGGSFGGPILKERFFFFGAFEGTRRHEALNVLRIGPTETLKLGTLRYRDAAGSLVSLSPANVRTIDPAGIGVNSNSLAFFNTFPRCNDFSQGLDAPTSQQEADALNFCGIRFNSPINADLKIYVARLDYHLTRDARHVLGWRGVFNDVSQDIAASQLPGQPIAQSEVNNSKGNAASYTARFTQNFTSVFRYGFTKEDLQFTGDNNISFTVRSFDQPFSSVRALLRNVPVHNFVEDASWIRGRHNLQFGLNIRLISNNRSSFANSFPTFSVNDGFCQRLCNDIFTNVTDAGFPAVRTALRNPFKRAVMGLYGLITTISSAAFFDGSSNVLAGGQGTERSFVYREHEYYFQDVWRATKNLTLTLGIRFNYYGVPYEKNGFQTGTTVNISEFIKQRDAAQRAGFPSATIPPLSWDLIGQANNAPGYYEPDKNNWAPNVAFAYSPSFSSGWLNKIFGDAGKSVIRGGFRLVYDRIGGAFVVTQDLNGSVGLVSPISNRTGLLNYSGPACTVPPTVACAGPRFTGLGSLPNVASFVTVPAAGFPAFPPETIANRGFAIANDLRTPYSYDIAFSYGRELPGSMALEASYVGRLGKKLLAKADIAAPLIYLRDPVSGQTYADAINLLYDQSQQGDLPTSAITPIPYFQNLFSQIATTCGTSSSLTPTQAVYSFARGAFPSFTDSLLNIEGCADLAFPTFFQHQFDSLAAWTNLGFSNYHALQMTLRKRFTQGLTFDFNYTFSKSMDNASTIENAATRLTGQIADVFFPRNNYARSNFDLKHQMSLNWVYELPFGKGRWLGGDANGVLDAFISGWQTSGIIIWRGAFPTFLENGFNFPTNFFLTGPGTVACPINPNFNKNAPGGPNLFGGQSGIDAAFACAGFTRSGSSGSRNPFRGVRFANVDFGLRKTIKLPIEGHKFGFSWQVFNLFNHPNFDDRTMRTNPESFSTFGRYVSTIGADLRNSNGRVMQFTLSYEF